jgi:hypothetical protein
MRQWRPAKLIYDLKVQDAPISYTWPSKGGIVGYAADEATIEWATPTGFLPDKRFWNARGYPATDDLLGLESVRSFIQRERDASPDCRCRESPFRSEGEQHEPAL